MGSKNATPQHLNCTMDDFDFLASPIVTLVVGTEDHQQSFVVHETLLTMRSKNITLALQQGHWLEGEKRVIQLTEDEPATFFAYLHFTYRPESLQAYATSVHWDNFDQKYTGLCKVYVPADMLIDDNMMAAVFAQLERLSEREFIVDYKLQHRPIPIEAIRTIYEGTMAGDNTRSILVKTFSKLELLHMKTLSSRPDWKVSQRLSCRD
jgi:hypothetical protein